MFPDDLTDCMIRHTTEDGVGYAIVAHDHTDTLTVRKPWSAANYLINRTQVLSYVPPKES